MVPVSLTDALGPGSQLHALKAFVPDFKRIRPALNDLLTYPHLESIVLKKGDPLSRKKDGAENLRDLVIDGSARYVTLCSIDSELSRKVITWSSTLNTIIDLFDVASFVETMKPIAQSYADEARKETDNNQSFFTDFAVYIDLIGARIEEMAKKIDHLDGEIEAQSKVIADADILQALFDILREIYKLASTANKSDVQIATLLGLEVSSLKGSFGKLFTDHARLELVLASLRHLQSTIKDIRQKFIALHGSLSNVVTTSESLINVWDAVSERLESVADDTRTLEASQSIAVKAAWEDVAEDAATFQKAIAGLTDSPVPPKPAPVKFFLAQDAPNAHLISKIDFVPQTAEEVRIARLLHAAAASPYEGGAQSRKLFQGHLLAVEGYDAVQEKVVKDVLGPPSETLKRLNSLSADAGRIVGQFNELLETPYLDQLACDNPLDGSKTNIQLMTIEFKEEYIKLQSETIEVARKLASYATIQQTLLPLVVAGVPNASKGELSLREFIDTNGPLVKEYLASATKLDAKSLMMKNKWDNAIAVVMKAINECTEKINTAEESVKQLTAEQKKATLYSVLAGIGAFIAFTAAAFLPGFGILVALGVGGVLGGLSVQQAIQAKKLGTAINTLRTEIRLASDRKTKLEALLPLMQRIAESLSTVSQIWSDIATTLQKADALNTIIGGTTGPILLEKLRPVIIANWKEVEAALVRYINAIQ